LGLTSLDIWFIGNRIPVWVRICLVAAGILVISVLHQLTPPSKVHWHNAFQNLDYLPIVLAGWKFGWRGGLAAGLFAGLSNLPFSIEIWSTYPNFAIDQTWDIPLFCAAGTFTGVLTGRERRQRAELERTTHQLTRVYQTLHDNFEQMKRAERLFALGQLSAGLAHEVRNPLASILGAAGILQRNVRLEKREAECLAIIIKECDRLNHLVAHFLAFARPRHPSYQTVEVGPLIDSVLSLASHAVEKGRIVLLRDIQPLGPIECDPELVQQVLLNLVINSIQSMADGGQVLVRTRPIENRVVIEIRDEGCGIPPGDREKIFDPFFTTKETGTGLGLSVAHKIVEQHGGILSAENNPDKGMTFTVQLPTHRARQHET